MVSRIRERPVKFTDPDGRADKPAIYPTLGAAVNLDFGRDYSSMAHENFQNGHYIAGAIQMLDSTCEAAYDLGAAFVGAEVVGGVGAAIVSAAPIAEKSAEQLKPYAEGLGHHPVAQAAFRGDPLYNFRTALAVPKAVLEKMNISHSTITGFQQGLYRAFSQTGKTLTWESLAKIETQALSRAGVDTKIAESWVNAAIQNLKDAGVINPTRIPWGD